MFIVLLKFGDNRGQAGPHLDGHKAWLARGFDDGVFVLAGGIQPGAGGAIVAHATTLPELRDRVKDDPFVAHGVVVAEILEILPSRAEPRLQFLLG